MSLTTAQMDQIVNNHFGYEATDDVEGVLSTLTDDARHEVIPSPVGELTDRNQQRAFYKMLFSDLKGEGVTPIRRLYGKDFLVDETIWHGRIENGRQFLLDGKSGPVSFRLLHVFELAGGKIKSEQVWCDLAAIQSQLGA